MRFELHKNRDANDAGDRGGGGGQDDELAHEASKCPLSLGRRLCVARRRATRFAHRPPASGSFRPSSEHTMTRNNTRLQVGGGSGQKT